MSKSLPRKTELTCEIIKKEIENRKWWEKEKLTLLRGLPSFNGTGWPVIHGRKIQKSVICERIWDTSFFKPKKYWYK